MTSRLPRVSISGLRKALGGIIVGLIVFWLGYSAGSKGLTATGFPKVEISRETPVNRENVDFSLFWRVWDTLDLNYFDKAKLSPSDMVYGAIQGMVSAIGDPYTVFLTPNENTVVQEDLSGSFEGVGIQIGFRGSTLAVIAPLPDSPAEAVGVEAGDYIIGIKDERKGVDRGTTGITLPEAVEIIRGPAGSVVTLTLLRDGEEEPILADITRASIDVPSVVVDFVGEEESIAHVRILKFSAETLNEWEEAIKEILKNGSRAVILDVRNNPGGFLQAAVDIAGEFVKSGSTVVIEENASGEVNEFVSERFGRMTTTPVVVLINKGSASASEILAGALRDIKDTPLVGETTFGKGTIQEPRQINGGAGLHITTARWLTPDRFWVDDGGLLPDIEIQDDGETPEDEQLQAAIELLNL